MRASWLVNVVIGSVLVAGASLAGDVHALVGRWVLESIAGAPVAAPEVYFEIIGDRIQGFDGCNRFGGSLSRGAVVVGQRFCEGDYVRLPLDLVHPIAQLDLSVVSDDRLSLPLADSREVAVFRRSSGQ